MSKIEKSAKNAANKAFNAVEYFCRGTDMRAGWILKEALKHERKERSSIYYAKALIVESYYQGYKRPSIQAHSLYGYSWGCQQAMIMGAGHSKRQYKATKRMLKLCRESIKAHRADIERRLADI